MSVEEERFKLRQRAHEEHIAFLEAKVALKMRELEYFESEEDKVVPIEPSYEYETRDAFQRLRYDNLINSIRKEIADTVLEVENNKIALAEAIEAEDARSNRH